MRESSNNYQVVNQFGYLGAYQFGMARLCDLGYTERIEGTKGYSNKCFQWKPPYSRAVFLNSKADQDSIFNQHIRNIIGRLKISCMDYIDKEVNGTFVSLSGAVAGCHLIGYGGFRQWCKGSEKADGNGVFVEEYIELFNNYDLSELFE